MATKYLVKTVETYRLECRTDVENFHEWLQQDAERQGYLLNSFSYVEKAKKQKGEVFDEWYQVKVTKLFEDEKCPDLPLKTITYENYIEELADDDDEDDVDGEM